jgi:hypothetical protein
MLSDVIHDLLGGSGFGNVRRIYIAIEIHHEVVTRRHCNTQGMTAHSSTLSSIIVLTIIFISAPFKSRHLFNIYTLHDFPVLPGLH